MEWYIVLGIIIVIVCAIVITNKRKNPPEVRALKKKIADLYASLQTSTECTDHGEMGASYHTTIFDNGHNRAVYKEIADLKQKIVEIRSKRASKKQEECVPESKEIEALKAKIVKLEEGKTKHTVWTDLGEMGSCFREEDADVPWNHDTDAEIREIKAKIEELRKK